MKLIVSSFTLLKQLQSISGVLTTNATIPILENFLFQLNNNELTITASDLETTITTKLKVESKDKGTIAIPGKILLEILKTFNEQPLTFSINDKNNIIEISSDYGKYKLNGEKGEDYPRVPVIDKSNHIELPSAVLHEAINKTIFATGNDDLRPVMSGVFCQLSDDSTVFVATDAHRLVRYRRTDIKSKQAGSFILPKKPLTLLKNILPSEETRVKVDYNEANAFFSFENYELICRLIDGRYPNYEAVIPVDNPNVLTIDRVAFLNSIKRVAIFANKTTYQVKLAIKGSELAVSAEDVDFANEANERLTCSYEGADMDIAFNARFLADMVANLDTEEIQVHMSLPNRAGILTPGKDHATKGEDILMLVMPVMIG
ncbi:MAG: DNA polymerase III subunit beta [Bacteroidetes bacterium]|nr:Beta sliding clamp [Bacteroidia bacterium]MCE7954392.1 DNA polymerase III subunit beta [Bacteroidetes bacterium CHB6]MCO5289962.1 DNA polymerase III subunit beta [Bacteroidota bacterium]